MKHDLSRIASQFQLQGHFVKDEPYGSGHINDTYAVSCDEVRYIFQRINHTIFKDPPALMENISRVTRHVRAKLEAENTADIERRCLTLIPTLDGGDFLLDEEGLFWRAYIFVERAKTYDVIENTRQAYEAAKAFGRFQCQLADMPPPRLNETIPNFHNTRARYGALRDAVEQNVCGRVDAARHELAFTMQRETMVDALLKLQASGDLTECITHNDTKLNNVMIDDVTSEGVCVIDLDTVMPGLALYDFGDMVRTATNTGAEDERDLSKVSMNLEMFEALAKGYRESAGAMLSDREIELMPFAGKLITFETGLRFLTDYLAGDIYFKTHREGHNLDRCRTQFKLVKSMETQEEEMARLVAGL